MNKQLLSKALPHAGAIFFFVIITLIYFNPVLEGYKIKQDDILRFQGMSKEIQDYREKNNEEPLWTNAMFCGMPAYQVSILYSGNLTSVVDSVLKLGLPHPAGLVFLYFLGFYLLLISLGLNAWQSVLGALFFGFSSYFFIIIQAGHNSKAHAIGYMAPVIAGILMTYRGKIILGGAITALALALQISCNHLQITYYLMLAVMVLVIIKTIYAFKQKYLPVFVKQSAILAIAAIFALGPSAANLWATYEYSKYTIRGKSELTIKPDGTSNKEDKTGGLGKKYATDWSYGVGETFTLLIPNYMGGSSQGKLSENSEAAKVLKQNRIPQPTINNILNNAPTYWGSQPFTSGPVYIGAIVVFLFVLGMFILKGEIKWWLFSATLLSIALAWGKNFSILTDFFLHYFPGYNKFRAVSMTLVIAEFTMPLLAILALKEIFVTKMDKKEIFKNVKYAFYITGGITLLFAVFSGMFDYVSYKDADLIKGGFPEWLVDAIQKDRQSLLQADAIRSFVFILLAAAVLWALINEKLQKTYAYIVLILLIVVDMWTICNRYMNNEKAGNKYVHWETKKEKRTPYTMQKADHIILQDKETYFRVMDLNSRFDQDARTSYFHKNIGGYHGAKLMRIQELIDFHLNREQYQLNNIARQQPEMLPMYLSQMQITNMLNTKYIIPNIGAEPVQNAHKNGNAWFIKDTVFVANADSEIMALPKYNLKNTLIISNAEKEKCKNINFEYDANGKITLSGFSPKHLTYAYQASKPQLVAFSEIYYPKGWNAYIDGKPATYFRGNYLLRAMAVPEGKHTIEFKFEPKAYYVGNKVSYAGSFIIFILFLGALFYEFKNRKSQQQEAKTE